MGSLPPCMESETLIFGRWNFQSESKECVGYTMIAIADWRTKQNKYPVFASSRAHSRLVRQLQLLLYRPGTNKRRRQKAKRISEPWWSSRGSVGADQKLRLHSVQLCRHPFMVTTFRWYKTRTERHRSHRASSRRSKDQAAQCRRGLADCEQRQQILPYQGRWGVRGRQLALNQRVVE